MTRDDYAFHGLHGPIQASDRYGVSGRIAGLLLAFAVGGCLTDCDMNHNESKTPKK